MRPPVNLEQHDDLERIKHVANVFADNVRQDCDNLISALIDIDRLNAAEKNPDVCHSRDRCDANMCMDSAIGEVTGSPYSRHQQPPADLQVLWDLAWRYTRQHGFYALGTPRGMADSPKRPLSVTESFAEAHTWEISAEDFPTPEPETFPLDISLDYFGRTPLLQVLCREHNGDGEPVVHVRYDKNGKVVELLVSEHVRVYRDGEDNRYPTPWEVDQHANPACAPGEKLMLPSGEIVQPGRLQDNYANLDEFCLYAERFGLLSRMDGYPGVERRSGVFNDAYQAWEVNPLIASSVTPSDYGTVPKRK